MHVENRAPFLSTAKTFLYLDLNCPLTSKDIPPSFPQSNDKSIQAYGQWNTHGHTSVRTVERR